MIGGLLHNAVPAREAALVGSETLIGRWRDRRRADRAFGRKQPKRAAHRFSQFAHALLGIALTMALIVGGLRQIPPRRTQRVLQIADRAYQRHDYSDAIASYVEVLRSVPLANTARFRLACSEWLTGRRAAAAANLNWIAQNGVYLGAYPRIICGTQNVGQYFKHLRIGRTVVLLAYLPAGVRTSTKAARGVLAHDDIAVPTPDVENPPTTTADIATVASAMCLALNNNMAALGWDAFESFKELQPKFGTVIRAADRCLTRRSTWFYCVRFVDGLGCRPTRYWVRLRHRERPV